MTLPTLDRVTDRALAADVRLVGDDDTTSLRVVVQATYLLVSGPTSMVQADELDDEAARWLDDGGPPDGAAVLVTGAGASQVTAGGERVRLDASGRGERQVSSPALGPGAEVAVETADAGTVATRLPEEVPVVWVERGSTRRILALRPLLLRVDLIGLRLSIVWCGRAPIEPGSEGVRVLLDVRGASPRGDAASPEWDVDSTVSIDGTAPASLPLPFVDAGRSSAPVSGPGPRPPAPAPAPAPAPVPAASVEEKRSIGQILAAQRPAPTGIAPSPTTSVDPAAPPIADPSRAGRERMGARPAEESADPAARVAPPGRVPPLMVLHVEPGTSARLRRAPRWRAVLQGSSRAAQRAGEEAGDDPGRARDARDAVAALRGAAATPLGDLGAALARGVDDGVLVPPLLIVDGELELPLDEGELLRATVEAVTPLRTLDARVDEAVARARPFVDAPWLDAGVAEAERAHLRQVVASLGRGHTADALDAQVERKLRRERKHVARTWRGSPWIEAHLVADGARARVLIPRGAVDVLPVARRFAARLLVEVQPAIEPDDRGGATLFLLALARDVGAEVSTARSS